MAYYVNGRVLHHQTVEVKSVRGDVFRPGGNTGKLTRIQGTVAVEVEGIDSLVTVPIDHCVEGLQAGDLAYLFFVGHRNRIEMFLRRDKDLTGVNYNDQSDRNVGD